MISKRPNSVSLEFGHKYEKTAITAFVFGRELSCYVLHINTRACCAKIVKNKTVLCSIMKFQSRSVVVHPSVRIHHS